MLTLTPYFSSNDGQGEVDVVAPAQDVDLAADLVLCRSRRRAEANGDRGGERRQNVDVFSWISSLCCSIASADQVSRIAARVSMTVAARISVDTALISGVMPTFTIE